MRHRSGFVVSYNGTPGNTLIMQSTLFRQNKPFSIAYVYKSKKDGATPTLAQLLTKLYDGLFLSKFYFFLVFTLSRDNNGKRRHKIFFSMFLVHCNLQWRREKKIQRHPKVKTKYFEKWIILIMSTTLFSRRIKRSPLWKKKIITFGDSAKKTAVDLVFFFFWSFAETLSDLVYIYLLTCYSVAYPLLHLFLL